MLKELLNLNYGISAGDKMFDPMQVENSEIAVQVEYEGVLAEDVKIELYQSIRGEKPALIPDCSLTVNKLHESMVVNLAGITPKTFIHVKVVKGAEASANAKITAIRAML